MFGWLYIIKNRDLYKIGITRHLDNRMKQLKPDYVVAKLYTCDFLKLEKELHNKYKKLRIPQTEYFRLEKYHLKYIKKRLYDLEYSSNVTIGIFVKSLLVSFLIFFILLIVISLSINDIKLVITKSLLLTEKILLGLSIITISVSSGKYLSFFNELKYRATRVIFCIFFALIARIISFII